MKTDREFTIDFIKKESPDFYEQLKISGEIDSLSVDELEARYASICDKPSVDISDISDDEISPVNMNFIEGVIKEAKIYDNSQQKNIRSFSLGSFSLVKRLALVASFAILAYVGITVSLSGKEPSVYEFVDLTSIENTDYPIRVRGEVSDESVYHEDLVSEIQRVLKVNLPSVNNGHYKFVLRPINGSDSSVCLSASNSDTGKSSEVIFTLAKRSELFEKISQVVPRMITEISE